MRRLVLEMHAGRCGDIREMACDWIAGSLAWGWRTICGLTLRNRKYVAKGAREQQSSRGSDSLLCDQNELLTHSLAAPDSSV